LLNENLEYTGFFIQQTKIINQTIPGTSGFI